MITACFQYGPLILWGLMLFTVVRPLRLDRTRAVLLAAVLLALSQKFLVYTIFGGDPFVPDLPERFINFTGWTYSSCVILFGLSLVPPYRRPRLRLGICAVVAVLLAGWGVWQGVRVPDVHRVEIDVKGLPPEFDGFRIVHLTDLHCSSAARRARTEGIVERVNALRPDVVCITGDLADGLPKDRAEDLSPLARLSAAYGVFGCMGNHEYFYDFMGWRAACESFGVTFLDNSHRILERNGARIALGGVPDVLGQWHGPVAPDVERAFAGAPPKACRILLQHRPSPNLDASCAQRVRLQLSGHTHGGVMWGMDWVVAKMNGGFVRGLYRIGDLALYVSPGTGQWAGFPLRLGVSAEITEIVLHPRI